MENFKQCQLEVTWEPTKDPRVTNHKIEIYPGGSRDKYLEFNVPPSTSSFIFNCIDGSSWHIISRSQIENDDEEVIEETVESYDLIIPILDKPIPISKFNWKLTKITDDLDLENFSIPTQEEVENTEDEQDDKTAS